MPFTVKGSFYEENQGLRIGIIYREQDSHAYSKSGYNTYFIWQSLIQPKSEVSYQKAKVGDSSYVYILIPSSETLLVRELETSMEELEAVPRFKHSGK